MSKLVRAGKLILRHVLKQKNPQEHRALFLHIQKTAGSSIIELAKDHFGNSVISHGDFNGHKPEEFQDVAFVSGHFGYTFAKSLMDSRYSFTFLRDPVERILSFYFYNRSRDIDEFPMTRIAHELDLEQFLRAGLVDPLVKSRIWNNQTWQMAHGFPHGIDRYTSVLDERELQDLAISHIKKFSYIGFVESFEDDLKNILPNLGIPTRKEITHINVTKERLYSNNLSSSTLEILEELTALDQVLYKEAKCFMNKQNVLK